MSAIRLVTSLMIKSIAHDYNKAFLLFYHIRPTEFNIDFCDIMKSVLSSTVDVVIIEHARHRWIVMYFL